VTLAAFPDDVIAAARKEAVDVLNEIGSRDEMSGKVHASYASFRERTAPWSRVSIEAVLRSRA
jgi:TRAP-type mannitol/chloroaromatic compound transport system substrate-binding protein